MTRRAALIATLALAAVALALHPRAALSGLVLCGLLHLARYPRLAIALLAVLTIATLAGVRVDAAAPAPVEARR